MSQRRLGRGHIHLSHGHTPAAHRVIWGSAPALAPLSDVILHRHIPAMLTITARSHRIDRTLRSIMLGVRVQLPNSAVGHIHICKLAICDDSFSHIPDESGRPAIAERL
jgi:hypothetical protein